MVKEEERKTPTSECNSRNKNKKICPRNMNLIFVGVVKYVVARIHFFRTIHEITWFVDFIHRSVF
jgi:hypothetical protein